MQKKVNIPENGKIRVKWNVLPYDYTPANKDNIRSLAAKKYGIPEKNVEIETIYMSINGEEPGSEITKELHDLCNVDSQLALFKKFLTIYNVSGYDWEIIKSINADVDSQISYEKYDKYRKYRLKWIKWDNFLSYGENNFFNFETLEGLVLLNGAPANQTGKTTFAIDLIHFLLFGKPSPGKADVNAKIFNKYTKSTTVKVEGCINIDGTDYVIRRTLTRPAKFTAKSKVSGTLEYFKVEGDNTYVELKDVDSATADVALNEHNVQQTNKVIKEAIGKEDDFDLIICATQKSLDDLIDKGDTERGKLMTRWLGLDVIDDKYKVAKDVHERLTQNYVSRVKNKETLRQEILLNIDSINENKQAISICEQIINSCNTEINAKQKECNTLRSQKVSVDENLLKYNKQSIENTIESIKQEGAKVSQDIENKKQEIVNKKEEIEKQTSYISSLGVVDFKVQDLKDASDAFSAKNMEITTLMGRYNDVNKKKDDLKHGEFCPTCKQRLINVDNSSLIAECDIELNAIVQKGKLLRAESVQLKEKLDEVTELGKKAELINAEKDKLSLLNSELSKLELAQSALEISREKKRNDYKEAVALLNDYNANKEAIDKNEEMDRLIVNVENLLQGYRTDLLKQTSIKSSLESTNDELEKKNKQNENDIQVIEKEEVFENNWKIYLEMLGKNGVSKMEVRELTPIINIKLKEFLSGIVDFDVEVNVTDKNDVVFNLVTEEKGNRVVADLTSGSGFERTCAALAVRFVLGSITSIPQPNFFVIDEVIGGGVASENYEKVHKIFEREINAKKNGIDFVLHCTHIDDIKDWHKSIITVQKKGRVSSITSSSMG